MSPKNASKFKLEEHLNDWVKNKFKELNLHNQKDYYTESAIPGYLKEALKGRAKTENKTNFGKPDFSIDKYIEATIIIENKLGLKNLLIETSQKEIKLDEKSVKQGAVNGAIYYATGMIASGKCKEVIAIGIAGESEDDIKIQVYYVYGSSAQACKLLKNITTLNFLENQTSFSLFYKDAVLTEEEKHKILITSREILQTQAQSLNKLMHKHNITAPQRVLYVAGILLSLQTIFDENGDKTQDGLIPDDLKGIQTETKRDGIQIYNQIDDFLNKKQIPENKLNLMLSSFYEIAKDTQRDTPILPDKKVSKYIKNKASINKQIFTFIYHNIFLSIDAMSGHLDIMGEMYSEFLKYALGDGKELGIVLTPPYVTKMMASIIDVNKDSKVMDLAAGSAGFLISAMELMIKDTETLHGKNTTKSIKKIEKIKKEQLLGIELNAEMFTLAATNMILRGDGSSNIHKNNTFDIPEIYATFKADKLLLNPPFSYSENGMPFIKVGLDNMQKGGIGAIIIQDSAGSGQAIKTNQAILKKHTLLASIKMPTDLFHPLAGVQTSIYIFKSGTPHDYEKLVKFIDFRKDGYKRSENKLHEINKPTQRYQDIVKIYKAGSKAKVEANWKLDTIYIEDYISDRGKDWNFDQHKVIDTKPTLEDFKKTVSDYLAWEVSNILKNQGLNDDNSGK